MAEPGTGTVGVLLAEGSQCDFDWCRYDDFHGPRLASAEVSHVSGRPQTSLMLRRASGASCFVSTPIVPRWGSPVKASPHRYPAFTGALTFGKCVVKSGQFGLGTWHVRRPLHQA